MSDSRAPTASSVALVTADVRRAARPHVHVLAPACSVTSATTVGPTVGGLADEVQGSAEQEGGPPYQRVLDELAAAAGLRGDLVDGTSIDVARAA
ncbi:hypothetical protein [Nocardioides zeae]|uniref:Uncharacterized protein n=1 Tax=Nocardioides zeae TaxID=1457234 RepID=A0AAJ1X4B9_9ACTN|nr:hypothetical protein [Nocardioides zeae]MDQ1105427.1 hypothetical protein [Nocardioides zeae]